MNVESSGYPRRFGSYVLLKPLARGGMGELDIAVTGARGMEKLCVIKRVLPHLLVTDNVQRFREEAMVVVRLSHGNLVGILDAGREDDQFYLVMDFVEGKDLLATWNQCATKRVAFPIEIAAYVIKELVRGLGYAHAYRDLRLVHRDVSPANVLLAYSGEVKLTDFGLATSKLKEQQTSPGIIYGKLAYLAPEQARGLPLDGRTDLYAAGILLWEMLTGQQLFPTKLPRAPKPASSTSERQSTLEALERVRHPAVAAPSSLTGRVPPELDAIVLKALEVDPQRRYQTGEEMRADLAAFLAKHAHETDAATLASFMALLWQEEINQERAERDRLLQEASPLLPTDMTRKPVSSLARAAATRTPPAGHDGRPFDVNEDKLTPAPAVRRAEPDTDSEAVTGALPEVAADPFSTAHRRGRRGGDQSGRRLADRRAVFGGGPSGQLGASSGTASPWPSGGLDLGLGSPLGSGFGADLDSRLAPGLDLPAALPIGTGEGALPSSEVGGGADGNMPEQEDTRVGTTIGGRYYLRRLCGEGAMGRVYEGHHVEIGRRVAIKILHSNFRNTPDVVERFRREARAASRIGHPNIVDVTDSGTTTDGAFFFVMEYLDGIDLEQLIAREGPLAIDRALLVAAQVCRALVAAHSAKIIHRDLKPANIMLVRHRDEEDFVKVLDFGISKQTEMDIDPRGKNVGLTRPDAAVGTPIYMAPEQVAGLPADGRTDVYAVGELVFEMLTGTQPCSGSDVIAVFNRKANEDPPPVRSLRPEIPDEIERMLLQAMSRRAADRHESMAALKDEIMRCLGHLGATPAPHLGVETGMLAPAATSVPVPLPPAPTAPRSIWITGGGIAAGLALAALVVLSRVDLRPNAPSSGPAPRAGVSAPAAAATNESASTAGAPRGSDLTPVAALPPTAALPAGSSESSAGAAAQLATPTAQANASGPGNASSNGTLASSTIAEGLAGPPTGRESVVPGDPRETARARRAAAYAAGGRSRRATRTASRAGSVTATGAGARAATPTAPSLAQVPQAPEPVVTLLPSSGSDSLARGRTAFAKGNFPEAVRLGRVVLGSGDAVGGHLLLGDSFYKMARYGEALAQYEAALRVSPTNPQAQRGRELALRRSQP